MSTVGFIGQYFLARALFIIYVRCQTSFALTLHALERRADDEIQKNCAIIKIQIHLNDQSVDRPSSSDVLVSRARSKEVRCKEESSDLHLDEGSR